MTISDVYNRNKIFMYLIGLSWQGTHDQEYVRGEMV